MNLILRLPATPAQVRSILLPMAYSHLPDRMRGPAADCQLAATAMQESNLNDRRQGTPSKPGPARGLWQFERIGVAGVMERSASAPYLKAACVALRVAYNAKSIHLALETDDVLAAIVARLNYWTDERPLPRVGDTIAAFDYYVRNWRPGACNTMEGRAKCFTRWKSHYPSAVAAVA